MLEAWSVDAWNIEEGLPQSSVNAFAPTTDGRLWLGTFAGVASFDGQGAQPLIADGERPLRVTALRADGDALWVGTESGGLWRWDGQGFERESEGLRTGTVRDVKTYEGVLWIATERGVWTRSDGDWELLFAESVVRLDVDDEGAWLCGFGGLWRVRDQQVVQVDPRECVDGARVPDGRFGFLTETGITLAARDGTVVDIAVAGIHRHHREGPLVDGEGRLWIASNHELWDMGSWEELLQTGEGEPERVHVLEGMVTSLYETGGTTIWAGTSGAGMVRVRPLGFAELVQSNGVHGRYATGPVETSGGNAYFALGCYTLIEGHADGSTVPVELPESRRCISSIADGGSSLLVSRKTDVLRRHPDGRVEVLLEGHLQEVTAMAQSGGGGVWAGDGDGRLMLLQPGVDVVDVLLPERAHRRILTIRERGDQLYVGFDEGVAIRTEGTWRVYGTAEGLPHGAVRDLVFDPSGLLWVVTYGSGIGWIENGRAGALPWGPSTLPDPYLSGMGLMEDGTVWLHGNSGLTRTHRDDLLAARGTSVGIPTTVLGVGEANGWRPPSAAVTGDALWLAGVMGVAVVDLRALGAEAPVPAARVTHARVGDRIIEAGARVEPDAWRRLEVHYTAPTLDAGRPVRYQHRLRSPGDLGARWVNVGADQRATYAELRPGHYVFEVRAQPQGGDPGPPAELAFSILPKWYERDGMRPAGVLSLLLLVLLGMAVWTRLTARRNRELALREARYRQVFENSGNAFLLYGADGACVDVNAQACRLFGATESELRAARPELLGLQGSPPVGTPILCTRMDGSRFPARVDGVACALETGEGWLWSVVDLTVLVDAHEHEDRLRHQLFQARRLEALGRLAGGLAHDMNNLLGVVSLNLGELRAAVPSESQACLEDAEEGVGRGVALIKQLLAFSSQKPEDRGQSDLFEVARGLEGMLKRLLPSGLTLDVRGERCEVGLSRSPLEQVVLNLVLNASDAAPTGTTVLVSVRREGGHAVLEVVDQGEGVAQDSLDLVFDPFYTTKGPGSGTGLGLATVKRVVEEVDGSVALFSDAGGTRVVVKLPLVEARAEATPKAADGPLTSLRLAVVDDNEVLLRSLSRSLSRMDFQLQTWSDPEQARRDLLAASAPPDVLVTDVVMPGLNGRQLADAVRKRWPGTPVVFISGYTADVLGHLVEAQGETLLAKPFYPEELARTVRNLHADHG